MDPPTAYDWSSYALGVAFDGEHGNVDAENILVRSGVVVGIVDVMACGRGTRVYDLSTLVAVAGLWEWRRDLLER